MGKPSAPAPPDYTGAAVAQGDANVDAALASAALANPTTITPYGTTTYTNPAYDAAMAAWTAANPAGAPGPIGAANATPDQLAQLFGKGGTPPDPNAPGGMPQLSDFLAPGNFERTQAFSPELQALFDRATGPIDAQFLTEGADANRMRAEDSLYNIQARYLDPRFAREDENLEAQLLNRGALPGSELYGIRRGEFADTKNRAYQDAMDKAIIGGGSEASRTFAENLQKFLTERNQPLNELGALQRFLPTAGGTGSNIAGAPIFDATMAQGNAAQQQFQTESGQYGSTLGAGAQLGSAALMMYLLSDRRLKSNIVRVATHKLGIGIYEYDIFGERQRGVMADEVEKVLPAAVMLRPDGYKMVNYGLL